MFFFLMKYVDMCTVTLTASHETRSQHGICNLKGTYTSPKFWVWFSLFNLVNEPLLNETNLVNKKLTLDKKHASLLDFSMNILLLCAQPPSIPLSTFKRIQAHACTPERLRAHLNGEWTAMTTISIYTTSNSGKSNLQPQSVAFLSPPGIFILLNTEVLYDFPAGFPSTEAHKINQCREDLTGYQTNCLNSFLGFSSCFVLDLVKWLQEFLCPEGCNWGTRRSSCAYGIAAHRQSKPAAEGKCSAFPLSHILKLFADGCFLQVYYSKSNSKLLLPILQFIHIAEYRSWILVTWVTRLWRCLLQCHLRPALLPGWKIPQTRSWHPHLAKNLTNQPTTPKKTTHMLPMKQLQVNSDNVNLWLYSDKWSLYKYTHKYSQC